MPASFSSTQESPLTDAQIISATRRWVERAVIGLNLCPFARAPYLAHRVRLIVSAAATQEQLAVDVRDEAQRLADSDPAVIETTLLIHPQVFADFLDYNDFLDVADGLLDEIALDGILQIASFHPDYRFADTDADAVENCSNRSPFPTLHLLRETSITQAVDAVVDTDAIWQRNITTLRALGTEGWLALWDDEESE